MGLVICGFRSVGVCDLGVSGLRVWGLGTYVKTVCKGILLHVNMLTYNYKLFRHSQ